MSHSVEEDGLVDGWLKFVCEGYRPMVLNTPPDAMVILGSGEPSDDGEDFTFKNSRSKQSSSLPCTISSLALNVIILCLVNVHLEVYF